jgi:hypothetical protein
VPLNPIAALDLFESSLNKTSNHILGKDRGFASCKNALYAPTKGAWWSLTENGNVVAVVEEQAIHREFILGRGKHFLLCGEIGTAGSLLISEPSGAKVRDWLGFMRVATFGAALTRVTFAQRRRTSSAVRVAI